MACRRVAACLIPILYLTFALTNAEDMDALVEIGEMMHTLDDLQAIAMECASQLSPNGTRDRATPCHNKTVDYVIERITNISGLVPTRQTYQELMASPIADPVFIADNVSLNSADWVLAIAGAGDAYGHGVAIPNLGCDESDFTNVSGHGTFAVIDRGNCSFCQKILNAGAAGFGGVVVRFMENQTVFGMGVRDCLKDTTIPAVAVTYELGGELIENNSTLDLQSNLFKGIRGVSNIILDVPAGDTDHVVVVGAHVDGVLAGPGINDNGSGTAMMLEMLRTFVELFGVQGGGALKNGFRICWWASEEHGLLGSKHYVATLPEEDFSKILLYLNFDMMGSPNGMHAINGGEDDANSPNESGYIQHMFSQKFDSMNKSWFKAGLARSDFASFMDAGIPMGGLLTGAEGIKTQELADKFGGIAGVAFDACYHRVCDTTDNINQELYLTMAKAGAATMQEFIMDGGLPKRFGRVPDPVPDPEEDSSSWVVWVVAAGAFIVVLTIAGVLYSQSRGTALAEPIIEDVEVQAERS